METMNHDTKKSSMDLRERGRDASGQPVFSDRRLYIQILAFGGCDDVQPVIEALADSEIKGALYLDINDPHGLLLAVAHEDPDYFVTALRTFIHRSPLVALPIKHDLTMLGRTYAIGYEADLDHVLLRRPLSRLCDPDQPWAVWYPLRRKGSFAKLSADDQRDILSEHGKLGAEFSAGDYGNDIRLACHGLDRNDNDFIIGLVGAHLHPLSAMVQMMRKTRQTSEFLEQLGPFIIGKALWQSPLDRSSS